MLKLGFSHWVKIGIVILSSALFVPTSFASGGGGETFAEGLNYLPIKPPLIVNYGGIGKIKFIKVEISMRVENNHNAVEVAHHMPLIRDTLIMLFSGMTDEQVSSGEGKELMRQQALAKVNEAIEAQMKIGHGSTEKKGSEHGKDENAKDEHAKDEHKKGGKAPPKKPEPVSDLFFDNLVVQK